MVRCKYRYLLIQIKLNDSAKDEKPFEVRAEDLVHYFKGKIAKYYGDFGFASSRIIVKYIDANSKLLIVRISHGPHRFLTSSLPFCTLAGKELCRYRTLYIGATIRQCKKFIVKFEREFIKSKIGSFKSDLEREKFIKDVSTALKNIE